MFKTAIKFRYFNSQVKWTSYTLRKMLLMNVNRIETADSLGIRWRTPVIGEPFTLDINRIGSRTDHRRSHRNLFKAKFNKFKTWTSGTGWAKAFNTIEYSSGFEIIIAFYIFYRNKFLNYLVWHISSHTSLLFSKFIILKLVSHVYGL